MKLRHWGKGIGAVGAFWAFLWGCARYPDETVMIIFAVAGVLASLFIFVMAAGPDE